MAHDCNTENSRQSTKDLLEALTRLELKPRAYSGRGMCGGWCVGISVERFQEPEYNPLMLGIELVAVIADRRAREDADDNDVDDILEEARDTAHELGTPSQDSLGLGSIIYWTGARVEKGRAPRDEDESEEDEDEG